MAAELPVPRVLHMPPEQAIPAAPRVNAEWQPKLHIDAEIDRFVQDSCNARGTCFTRSVRKAVGRARRLELGFRQSHRLPRGDYVPAVREVLRGLDPGLTVVDFGCGDFAVGSQLVESVASYIAFDVVPELIERNRQRFRAPGLRFQVVDAVDDPIPAGDVVCIRQVLQHLSNGQIAAVAPKLTPFRLWIITEHLPAEPDFVPNRYKRAGHDIRIISARSGIVLTAAPFNARPKSERVPCEVPESVAGYAGVIRTTLYSF